MTTLLFGLAASLSLVVGALIGVHLRIPARASGVILALAGGALMSAATLDLIQPALQQAEAIVAVAWFAAGVVTFAVVDNWLDRFADPSGNPSVGGRSFAWTLMAAVVLDGVPENLAMGLQGSAHAQGLVAAIVLSNLPEAMISADAAADAHVAPGRVVAVWAAAAVVLLGAVAAGMALGSSGEAGPAPWLAFASGAVVTAIADTLLPRAVDLAAHWSAPAAGAGFILGAVLSV